MSKNNKVKIQPPIKIVPSDCYNLVIQDASNKFHYFNKDGSYDGYSIDCIENRVIKPLPRKNKKNLNKKKEFKLSELSKAYKAIDNLKIGQSCTLYINTYYISIFMRSNTNFELFKFERLYYKGDSFESINEYLVDVIKIIDKENVKYFCKNFYLWVINQKNYK